MSKTLNRNFTKDTQKSNKHAKLLTPDDNQENADLNHNETLPPPPRMVYI